MGMGIVIIIIVAVGVVAYLKRDKITEFIKKRKG